MSDCLRTRDYDRPKSSFLRSSNAPALAIFRKYLRVKKPISNCAGGVSTLLDISRQQGRAQLTAYTPDFYHRFRALQRYEIVCRLTSVRFIFTET